MLDAVVIFSYGLLYVDLLLETKLRFLNFSWQRSFLKLMVQSYAWTLLFPTVNLLFHEIACNDSADAALRVCRADPAVYAVTAAGCVLLAAVVVVVSLFNRIYFVKDWLNKYDHLAMNAPHFMLALEAYLFVRAVTDALPFDEFNSYVYYVKCLLVCAYSGYMLAYAALKLVFQSLHVQQ